MHSGNPGFTHYRRVPQEHYTYQCDEELTTHIAKQLSTITSLQVQNERTQNKGYDYYQPKQYKPAVCASHDVDYVSRAVVL